MNSNVQRRISEEEKSNPQFSVESDRKKLDYCNIMDYAKIINSRWDIFEDNFPARSEVDSRFKDFADYRNGLAHNRDIDKFTEMDGKVAIEWINTCIEQES